GPVKLFPVARLAGGRTHGFIRVHLQFPPVKVLPVLSSRTTNWKSARLHGGVMLQLLSAPLQSGLGFFQYPLPATPSAFLADAPASKPRRGVGFNLFRCDDTNDLVPASHTGSRICPCAPSLWWSNRLLAFWPEPVSAFGSSEVDGAFGSLFRLDMSFSLTLRPPLTLVVAESSSRPSPRPIGRRYVVPTAFDVTVTSRADAGRLVRTEPHVLSMSLCTQLNDPHNSISSHSDIFPKHSFRLAPRGANSRKLRANVRQNYRG